MVQEYLFLMYSIPVNIASRILKLVQNRTIFRGGEGPREVQMLHDLQQKLEKNAGRSQKQYEN